MCSSLSQRYVHGQIPARTGALGQAARVVSWFGARDARFVRRLSDVAPTAVIGSPAPGGGTMVWEHFVRTVVRHSVEQPWLAPVAVPKPLVEEGRR